MYLFLYGLYLSERSSTAVALWSAVGVALAPSTLPKSKTDQAAKRPDDLKRPIRNQPPTGCTK